ncbi:cytochrome c biogenesis CcdA family protein [Methanolobus chelungpuianus]|uniref:cytochrome c biogenesis CcdA family protein n=1 Tax=Methanolobus chelungpuianus TaxID=502115 RepID=UPI0021153719|nr:cytochrome c biogenesis protein CcdA [Methanolobus chelungpuianus]
MVVAAILFPLQYVMEAVNNNIVFEKLILFAFIAGLFIGFNPCLLAVIVYMHSTLISSKGTRKDMIFLIFGFCAGIFSTYTIAGIWILNTVNSLVGIQENIATVMIVIVFTLGLVYLYDTYYMKVHRETIFTTPRLFTRFIKFTSKIKGVKSLALSFLGGALFSMIKVPLLGALYVVILEILISYDIYIHDAIYLSIHNFSLVLPTLLLGGMLAFGMDPEKVSDLKERRRVEIRFITGLTLLLLAMLLHFKVI